MTKTIEQELQVYGYNEAEIAEMVRVCDEWTLRLGLRHGALREPECITRAKAREES